jgi:hypothetical protein
MKRVLAIVALVLGSILLFHASFAVYMERQLLDTSQWTETSTELLQNPEVRSQVSLYLVDQIYANVDVSKELKKTLPEQLAPLSGVLAGGLRNLADKGVDALLAQPQIQTVWADANGVTHQALVDFLEGDTGALSASNGKVTLDLRTIANQVGNNFGINDLQSKLPPQAANLELADSQQLKSAQTAVKALKGTALLLSVLSLLFFILYFVLADDRRKAVRGAGIAFIIVGIVTLITRSVTGTTLVGQLVIDPSVTPAASSAWSIVTGLLRDQAWALIFYGAVAILGSLLAGPSKLATKVRKALAPWALSPAVSWIAFAVVILLLIAWAPVEGFRYLWTCILIVIIAGLGFELLRRQITREFPKAKKPDWEKVRQNAGKRFTEFGEDVREKTSGVRRRAGSIGGGRRSRKATDARLDEIQRLQELKKSGALTAKEFAAEKKRILGR